MSGAASIIKNTSSKPRAAASLFSIMTMTAGSTSISPTERVSIPTGRPVGIETRSVGEIDVEPAVMVIIEKSDAAALGFDDVFFMIDAAPDIGDGQASFAGCVDEPYGRNRR